MLDKKKHHICYILHLGKTPRISLLEMKMRYPDISYEMLDQYHVSISGEALCVEEMQYVLGGVVMISEVIYEGKLLQGKNLEDFCFQYIYENFSPDDGKLKIAFCDVRQKKMLFSLKKQLKKEKYSIRMIIPEKEMNSAHILKEKLTTEKGVCFYLLVAQGRCIISRVKTVQNIDAYSARDYDKPYRDSRNGMLPPKLARMMINMTFPSQKILDPFCGSGTLLLEGLDLGLHIDGSDIQPVCVEGSQKNIRWYQRYFQNLQEVEIFEHDATKDFPVSQKYDAICTEGYLGPVYTYFPSAQEIEHNFKMLENLYLEFFTKISLILQNKGKIVITFPCYHGKHKNYSFWEYFCSQIQSAYIVKKEPLLYGRSNQFVWRELVILERVKN